MVHRILRSLIDKGIFDHPAEKRPADYDANARIAQDAAEAAIVMLTNADGILPIDSTNRRIAAR